MVGELVWEEKGGGSEELDRRIKHRCSFHSVNCSEPPAIKWMRMQACCVNALCVPMANLAGRCSRMPIVLATCNACSRAGETMSQSTRSKTPCMELGTAPVLNVNNYGATCQASPTVPYFHVLLPACLEWRMPFLLNTRYAL